MCQHASFHVHGHVHRKVDPQTGTTTFDTEIRLNCEDCGEPFTFLANEASLIDRGGTILSVPCQPWTQRGTSANPAAATDAAADPNLLRQPPS